MVLNPRSPMVTSPGHTVQGFTVAREKYEYCSRRSFTQWLLMVHASVSAILRLCTGSFWLNTAWVEFTATMNFSWLRVKRDGEVADRNVGCPRGGVTYGFTWAVYTDTPRVIGGSYREIGQNVRHRGVCRHRLKRGQAARRRGQERGWSPRTVESGVFVSAKEEQFILNNGATNGPAETVVI